MTLSPQIILAIGLGGFLGAIARAYVVHFTNKYIPLEFPLGVLSVNLIGSFLIGVLLAYFSTFTVSMNIKSFLTTGFLGALTTYSTFAIETFLLFETSFTLAILNMGLNLFGSIIAAASGYKILHFLIK